MASEGYRNIAECVRLVETIDAYKSMISSYDRIHLKPGQKLLSKPFFDKTRINFKEFVLRRMCAKTAEYMSDCNVVFFENLNFKFDSDNDNNSLLRLFSAATILKFMEEALQKKGIGFVEVDKSGTSKTDPVTASHGWRDKRNKQKLHVIRDGKHGWIDSDLAATLNILIRIVSI